MGTTRPTVSGPNPGAWPSAVHSKGTQLELIPAGIVPWGTWLADHPDSLVLKTFTMGRRTEAPFREGYVIGVTLGEHAAAYPFPVASKERIINDRIGPIPVVVVVDPETKAVYIYQRQVGDRELEFILRDEQLMDAETQSTWDRVIGEAVEGSLKGELLQRVPYITSFDWGMGGLLPPFELLRNGRLRPSASHPAPAQGKGHRHKQGRRQAGHPVPVDSPTQLWIHSSAQQDGDTNYHRCPCQRHDPTPPSSTLAWVCLFLRVHVTSNCVLHSD